MTSSALNLRQLAHGAFALADVSNAAGDPDNDRSPRPVEHMGFDEAISRLRLCGGAC